MRSSRDRYPVCRPRIIAAPIRWPEEARPMTQHSRLPAARSVLSAAAATVRPPRAAAAVPPEDGPRLAPTIVHIGLQPESEQRFPIIVPTEPEITLELEFPWPLEDWIGRGFTPEPGKYAGDFIVDATRGSTRLFVAPIVPQAHRVLHVILSPVSGATLSVPIELIPAPRGLAWRKIVFSACKPLPDAGQSGSAGRRSALRRQPLPPPVSQNPPPKRGTV